MTLLGLGLVLAFTACSGSTAGTTSNSNVNFVFPREVIEQIVSRSVSFGDAGNVPCTLTVTLYVDSWAQEEKSEEVTLNTLSTKGKSFVFKEILVGTNVIAKAVVVCGDDSYSGWSKMVELTIDGAELSVGLTKDKRALESDDSVLTIQEVELPLPQEKIDSIGNEYWEIDASKIEALKNSKFTWFVDTEVKNETGSVLKIYKRLMGNGIHEVLLSAIDGNTKYTATTSISIYNPYERVAFVSTDNGLEFRINYNVADGEHLDYTNLREKTTGIIIECDGTYRHGGWTGCWPFVQPGEVYTFDLGGDYWEPDIKVTYEGTRNEPLSKKDLEILNSMGNYPLNNLYSVKEVNVGTDAAPRVHPLFTYDQKESEIYDLFKDSEIEITRIGIDFQFVNYYVVQVHENPDDSNSPTHDEEREEWFAGFGSTLRESGYEHGKYVDYDLYNRLDDYNKIKFDYVVNGIDPENDSDIHYDDKGTDKVYTQLNSNDDYELRLNFFYSLKGWRNMFFKIECTNDNNNHRNVKVQRLGSN